MGDCRISANAWKESATSTQSYRVLKFHLLRVSGNFLIKTGEYNFYAFFFYYCTENIFIDTFQLLIWFHSVCVTFNIILFKYGF